MNPSENITKCECGCNQYFELKEFYEAPNRWSDTSKRCLIKVNKIRKLVAEKNTGRISEEEFLYRRDVLLGRIKPELVTVELA